jgi:hypothetical protein
MQSPKPTQEQIEALGSHIQGQGKIAQLTQLRALSWLHQSEKRQAQTDQAERDWYERQLGKQNMADADAEKKADEMEMLILGDVSIHQPPNQPTPPPPQQPKSNSLLPIAAAGLLGLLGAGTGAAATAYLLSKQTPPAPQEFDFETMNLGLGRASDFLKDGAE